MATLLTQGTTEYNKVIVFLCLSCSTDYYIPTKRSWHSSHVIGDYLYMWGGDIDGLPAKVYDKRGRISVIEVFHLQSGRWEQQPTNGIPPPGVRGYASTVIGKRIFYFGGYCNNHKRRHNSIHSLTTDSLTWNELFPTTPDRGPMMKSYCGMINLSFNEEDYLLVFGGTGTYPTNGQPGVQYINGRTNEHHYYKLASGKTSVYIVMHNHYNLSTILYIFAF